MSEKRNSHLRNKILNLMRKVTEQDILLALSAKAVEYAACTFAEG